MKRFFPTVKKPQVAQRPLADAADSIVGGGYVARSASSGQRTIHPAEGWTPPQRGKQLIDRPKPLTPALGHHWNEDMRCACGAEWWTHAVNPQRCPGSRWAGLVGSQPGDHPPERAH